MFLDPKQGLEFGEVGQGELVKALSAGYGTDSANMSGGRSLIPQDIQNTLENALAFNKNDFKVFNLVRKNPVYSTVYEYTRMNDVGAENNNFVAEGGESQENTSNLERVTKAMKYLQTYRQITLQMRVAKTLEDAESIEKNAGTLEVLRSAEKANFHGNASVNPVEFDGIIPQIKAASGRNNIVDLRGQLMSSAAGEKSFTEIARLIYENGGYASHAFMPPVIAQDVQDLVKDRLRLNTGDSRGQMVVESYPTPFSDNIMIAGNAGPDKFFRVKSKVVASGDAAKRPDAPTLAVLAQAKTGGTGFVAATAGTYNYTVHAVNQYGVSASPAAESVAVAAGQQVQITITAAAGNATTGYIICRSKKDAADGTDTREMVRVGSAGPATVYLDQDDELPGTAELIILSHNEMEPSIQWDQFLPLMKFDLYPTKAAIIPFLIILFGAMDVKVPWKQGLVKNIAYTGLDWY